MSDVSCPTCGSEISSASLLPEDLEVCSICRTRARGDQPVDPFAAAAEELSTLPLAGRSSFAQDLAEPLASAPAQTATPPGRTSIADEYQLAPTEIPDRPQPASAPFRPRPEAPPEPEPTFLCLPLLIVMGLTLVGMTCLCPLSMFLDFPQGLLSLWGIGLIFGGIGWFGFRFKKFTGEHMQDEAPWYLRGGLAVMLQLTGYVIQEPVIFGPPFCVFVMGGLLCLSPMFIPDLRMHFRRNPAMASLPPVMTAPPAAPADTESKGKDLAATPAVAKGFPTLQELLESGPTVYLSDLEDFDVQAGPCPLGKNGELGNGSRIQVQKKDIPKGLGMHPPDPPALAKASYRLGKQRAVLHGGAALNDTAENPWGAAIFGIHGDGKLLWKSSPIKKRGKVAEFRLDLNDVEVLQLSVQVEGHSHYVHAVWVEPRLTKQ